MFFLLRTAFWLSVVLALLPSGGAQTQSKSNVGASEAVTAASAAVSDVSHFCGRQPDACAIGSQAAVAFGQRAQAGAKMVYEFLSEKAAEKVAGEKTDKSAPTETGSVKTIPARMAPDTAKNSQHTLRPADLQPAWHGPVPRRDRTAAKRSS